MRLPLRHCLLAAVACLACPAWASAAFTVTQGNVIKLQDGPGLHGGVFFIENVTTGDPLRLPTFCVEITETINFGVQYTVANNLTTLPGGVTTNAGNKTLTSYVAWLYNSFLEGDLFGVITPANANALLTAANANALQLSIWKSIYDTDAAGIKSILGSTIGASSANSWVNDAASTLSGLETGWTTNFNSDVSSLDWIGYGNIRIMNLVGSTGAKHQDQLVRIDPPPVGSSPVPEAGSLAIWGLLGVVAVMGRRWRLQRGIA